MAAAQLYYGIANPEVGPDSCGIEMAQYIFFFAPDEKKREKKVQECLFWPCAIWG